MHAIIETGGKQYKVTEGDTLFIEKLASEAGENVMSSPSILPAIRPQASSGSSDSACATIFS